MAGKADIQAGGAFVRLFLKDDLTRGLNRALASAGKSMQSAGASMTALGAKTLAAGAAMSAPFVASIMAASDLQETMSKFGVVFGDRANDVKKWGDELAAQIGRGEGQVAGFLAANQDLFVPLGFDPGSAEALSKQLVGLTFDLASFNNMADADVQRDLQAALTGSGEVMKKYGVIVSEAAVKQQLLKEGIDPKAATEQQKVQARLNIIMAGTTAAQGDATRTAGGFANQLKGLQGKLTDVAAEIGNAILPEVTALVGMFKDGLQWVRGWARENAGMIKIAAAAAVAVVGLGAAMVGAGVTISAIGFALSGLATAIGVLGAVVGSIVSPVGLVVAALAIGAAAWVRYTESGQAVLAGLMETFGRVSAIAKTAFGGIADALKAGDFALAGQIAFTALELAARVALDALASMFGETFGQIGNQLISGDFAGAWKTATDGMLQVWRDFKAAVIETFAGVVVAVTGMWLGLQNKISKMVLDWANDDGPMGAAARAILGVDFRGMNDANANRRQSALQYQLEEQRRQRDEAAAGGDTAAVADWDQRIARTMDQLNNGTGGENFDPAAEAKRIVDEMTAATAASATAGPLAAAATARQAAAERGTASANERVLELEKRLATLRQQAAAGVKAAEEGVTGGAAGVAAAAGAPAAVRSLAGGIGDITTFSAAAAQAAGFGGSQSPQQRAADAAEKLLVIAEQQKEATLRAADESEKARRATEQLAAGMVYA